MKFDCGLRNEDCGFKENHTPFSNPQSAIRNQESAFRIPTIATDRIIATYRIETAHPIEFAAEVMAGEQSCGTFVRVPGETDELREHHAARVERITELEEVDKPSLPFSKPPKSADGNARSKRAEVILSFPLENIGPSLPNLLATVSGNLYELREFSGLKLMDLELPEAFAEKYPGPNFGVAGTRKLAGVENRPIIGTVVKPSVGLSPDRTAELVRRLFSCSTARQNSRGSQY